MKQRSIGLLLAALSICAVIPVASAMELTWRDVYGAEFRLADIRQPVALHFWATWCVPCRSELPELAAWKESHKDVNMVVISLDREMDTVSEFLSKEGVALPALLAKSNEALRLGVRGLPATVVLAADGNVKKVYTGPVPWNEAAFTAEFLDLMQP